MSCEGACLLDSEEGSELELELFLTRLRRCSDCPHLKHELPLVQLLLTRSREAARSQRRLHATIRKFEHEAVEFALETGRYEAQLEKFERFQRASTEEVEAALAHQLNRTREQEREIEALSVPIIHILDGIFVLPLIGVLTTARARVLTERLLEEVTKTQAHSPIIDVTGVGDIDTATADHLIKMISALRLLGARPILTGITPEVAQTLVQIGAELPNILTLRSVRQALRHIWLERQLE